MTKMLSQMIFVWFITLRPKKLPASMHQFLDVTKRRIMNQTKIICDRILVIDKQKLSEISAHYSMLLFRFLNGV